jgi:hypothetical protein
MKNKYEKIRAIGNEGKRKKKGCFFFSSDERLIYILIPFATDNIIPQWLGGIKL